MSASDPQTPTTLQQRFLLTMHDDPRTHAKKRLPCTLAKFRSDVPRAGTPQLLQSGAARRSPLVAMPLIAQSASLKMT